MLNNPYIDYNDGRTKDITYPNFSKTNKITFYLSDEAINNLAIIVSKFVTTKNMNMALRDILEQIGMHQLHIERPEGHIDSETEASTEDLRQLGYEDGFNGNVATFLETMEKDKYTIFHTAYLRGFIEGNYVRTKAYK